LSCLEHRKSGSSRPAAGDAPSRKHRSFIRVTRLVPRAPCLRATRFPSQSTFCRDRNSPSLAAMLCRYAYSEGIPSKHASRTPVHPISAARVLTNPAASFGLDTLLVRALSSPHLSDARMLPSDVCHPIHLSTHPHPRSRRSRDFSNLHSSLVRSSRFTPADPLRRDRSSTCKLFTCEPRGDLRHLTPLSPSPPAHRGLSTARVLAPGLPRPAHLLRRDA